MSIVRRLTVCAFGALTGLLISVPTPASADNCRVNIGRGYVQQSYVQQAYVAPTYQAQYQQTYYQQAVPYAVPYVVLPDTFYRVDSALAYARIAEAAAEAAVNRQATTQNQQLLALFQDFLKQQQAIQQGQKIPPANQPPPDVPVPQKGELPAVPAPPAPPGKAPGTNQTPAMAVNEFLVHNCASCHKPNAKRLDLTGDSASLTKAQLLDVYYRMTAPDDDKDVMPPAKKDKPRPTRIEDVNAVHALIKTAK